MIGTVGYAGIAIYFMYTQAAQYNAINSTFAAQVKDFSIFKSI